MENFERFGPYTRIAREGRVALVEFDRQDGLNALSVAAMLELTAVADSFEDDLDISAIVLSGTQTYFSAGADLKDPAIADRPTGLLHRRHAQKVGPNMCAAWERLEQITIAAVEGFCIGGGSALVAACDIRVAAEDARFRLPEIPLGMNMSWQSNPRLVNLMGHAKAKLFTILGETLHGPKALAWGLIEELVPSGTARTAALDLAVRFGAVPPIALRMSKQSLDVAAKALNHATTYMDRDQFILASTSNDQSEAISAFLEKRKPNFTGE